MKTFAALSLAISLGIASALYVRHYQVAHSIQADEEAQAECMRHLRARDGTVHGCWVDDPIQPSDQPRIHG